MRVYNKREENFLKLLEEISNDNLEYFSFFLQNKYFVKENNLALIIFTKQTKALLFIKKNIFDDLTLRKAEIKNMLEILTLTEFLRQIHLIHIFPNPEAENTAIYAMHESFDLLSDEHSNIKLNNDGLHIKKSDPSKIYNKQNEILYEAVDLGKYTYELIMNNFMGLLFVSEELNNFVSRGFKSIEDIRFKYAQITTWVSISIAFMFGLIGIFNPFNKNETKYFKLDKQQLDSILEYKNTVNQNVNELLKVIETNNKADTIHHKLKNKIK